MKQVLAIFRKDTRHLWPEILGSVAVLVALVLVYPSTWRDAHEFGSRSLRFFVFRAQVREFFAPSLVVLVPVTWWILIGRLVHGEPLVGNTQFWVTRPYEWSKLIVAKALFLGVFLYLPFLVAQCALLVEAKFNPLNFVPGLCINLICATAIFVLPIVALSSLTSNFGKLVLVILGLVLYIAAVAYTASHFPFEISSAPSGSLGDLLSGVFCVVGTIAVIMVQYVTRRRGAAWLILATTCLLLTGLGTINPDRWLMERQYPTLNGTLESAVDFAYAGTEKHPPTAQISTEDDVIDFSIPLTMRGAGDRNAVQPVALKAIIEGTGGNRWESGWQAVYTGYLSAENRDFSQSFKIRRDDYDRLKNGPVILRLAVAVRLAEKFETVEMPFQISEFPVSGIGICVPQLAEDNLSAGNGISCRSPLRRPELTYVTVHWTDGACPSDPSAANTVVGNGWVGDLSNDPAEFGITSVWQNELSLSNRLGDYHEGEPIPLRRLCPGSPISFSRYKLRRDAQIITIIENLRLPRESTLPVSLFTLLAPKR